MKTQHQHKTRVRSLSLAEEMIKQLPQSIREAGCAGAAAAAFSVDWGGTGRKQGTNSKALFFSRLTLFFLMNFSLLFSLFSLCSASVRRFINGIQFSLT